MDEHLEYFYKTINGKIYPVEIGYKAIDSELITYDYIQITDLCRSGCKNYNFAGGCPPRAPNFDHIKNNNGFGVLLYGRFYSKYKSPKVKASTRPYVHYKFQDLILTSLLNKISNQVVSYIGKKNIIVLSNGYCMGCGSKKCSFKSGGNICRNPDKRTFSLEATGINVQVTIKNVFDIVLQWYNKNNYSEVEYMTKVIGFFCTSEYYQTKIFNIIPDSLNILPCTYAITHHQ